MSVEVVSVKFSANAVSDIQTVDMRAALTGAGIWLVLEGFENGYVATENAADALHTLVTLQLAGRMASRA